VATVKGPLLGRRAVIAAGVGAFAGAAASALAAPGAARAADGDAMKIGQSNVGTVVTTLTVAGGDALEVESGDVISTAVLARNTASNTIGVLASSTAGVEAHALNPLDLGLYVSGKAKFTRSGTWLMAAGTSSVSINGLTIGPDTFALATLQTNRPGYWVQAAVPSVSRGRLTIYLSKKLASATKVAWILFD
jgi:hypothetical protein